MKIDEIYSEIIISLIKSNNFKYCYKIFPQLDLEKIDITQTIKDEIYKLLDINNNYIKQYDILKAKDIFNKNTKIDFYYILFKYILKNPIYIYQIPFLLNLRKKIIKIIKSNLIENLYNFNSKVNMNRKIKYVIKTIVDSKYYYNIFSDSIKLFKSLKIYPDNNYNEIKDCLYEYTIPKIIDRLSIINYLFKSKFKFREAFDKWILVEKALRNKRIKEIKNEDKELLFKYFSDMKKKQLLIKIFSIDIYEYLIKEINQERTKTKNVDLSTSLFYSNRQKLNSFHNSNKNHNDSVNIPVLNVYLNKNMMIKNTFMIKYNSYSQKEINNDINNYSISDSYNYISHDKIEKKYFSFKYKYKKSFFIQDIKMDYVKELVNGFYLVFTDDKIIIIIYSEKSEKRETLIEKIRIKDFENSNASICNIITHKSKNNIVQLVIQSNKKLYLVTLCLATYIYIKESIGQKKIKKINNNLINIYYNINNKTEIKEFINEPLIKGRKINDQLYVLISKSKSTENAELKFYNLKNQRKIKQISGYSFSSSQYCLDIISTPKTKRKKGKIKIVYACKQNNKNGILIVSNIKEKDEMIVSFHKTGSFEVFSICHLSEYKHKNKNTDINNTINSKSVEKNKMKKNSNSKSIINKNNISYCDDISYFITGGIDNNDNIPKVKIYQLYDNYEKDSYNDTIDCIKEIEIKNSQGAIIGLIPNSLNEEILCFDANNKIHLL